MTHKCQYAERRQTINTLRSPYPYFGGKSKAASLVWERFGDCSNFVEPFFGSGAVLLGRPHCPWTDNRIETINDKDCHISNFWRENIHEACRLLRMDLRDASNRAASLRRRGVPLKVMKHSGGRERSEKLSARDCETLATIARHALDEAEAHTVRKKVAECLQV